MSCPLVENAVLTALGVELKVVERAPKPQKMTTNNFVSLV